MPGLWNAAVDNRTAERQFLGKHKVVSAANSDDNIAGTFGYKPESQFYRIAESDEIFLYSRGDNNICKLHF